jgi:hypothetical protein
MRDTQKILRHAVFQTLNGNVTYNGSNIPVYDEKRLLGDQDNLFIILGSQRESDDSPDEYFITNSSIDIEIQHRTEFEVSKDAIDDVSDQVLQIIMPTPYTNGFPVQNLFQINGVTRSSTISRNFSLTDSQSIVAKIITITCKIIQQNP